MPKLTKKQKGVIGFIVAIAAFFGIKKLVEAAPKKEYCCPYCSVCFDTLEELQEHVRVEHPGERIPIDVVWEQLNE